MTKRFFGPLRASFAAVICAVAAAAAVFSQSASPLPAPTGPVNDYAGVIDQATIDRLNQQLTEYRDKTGVELAVAVVRTTGERDIFDYSLAVARGWGIGSKADDNPGALLFIAIDDRKYFTHISRDLEDELPDSLAGSLQRQYLVPAFKQGDYAKGVSDTLEAYIRTIDQRSSGTAATPTPRTRPEPEMSGSQMAYSGFCCLIVIGAILLIIWSNRGGGGRGRGNDWGGGFGSALPWIIGSAISHAASSSSSSGSWGGSSDWGGGSSWGGFGGGGDFGGGGAGGSW